ncbi:hypothetical protein ACFPQ6_13885 [Deinococcus petrolearius]|uniref:Uncharacterized protein n=1 Tax=Deinococcus petrolearius TaxID=1751295 RepID=A0ABW1DKZ1_9DEIO
MLQLGYAHAEAEGTWIDAILLLHGTLWRYEYRWTPDHEATRLDPVTELGDFRPYILIPRSPEVRHEEAWYDAKEYGLKLCQEEDRGGHPALFYDERYNLPLLLRPVPRSGMVEFGREVPRLVPPEIEDHFRRNPAAFAGARPLGASRWSALASALLLGVIGYFAGRVLGPESLAVRQLLAAVMLVFFVSFVVEVIRGKLDAWSLFLYTILSAALFVLGIGLGMG